MRQPAGAGGHDSAPESRPARRAAKYWSPLNNWWRQFFSEKGRRPTSQDVQAWFEGNADAAWGKNKPSWKEARVHAKCLRSTEQVRNYFREYRMRTRFGVGGGSGAGPSSSGGAPPASSGGDGPSSSLGGAGGDSTLDGRPLEEHRGTGSSSGLGLGAAGLGGRQHTPALPPLGSTHGRVLSPAPGLLPTAGSAGGAGDSDSLGSLIAAHNARIAHIGSGRSASPTPTSAPAEGGGGSFSRSDFALGGRTGLEIPSVSSLPADLGASSLAAGPETPTPLFNLLNPATVTTGTGMGWQPKAPTERLSRFHSQHYTKSSAERGGLATQPSWDRSASFGTGSHPSFTRPSLADYQDAPSSGPHQPADSYEDQQESDLDDSTMPDALMQQGAEAAPGRGFPEAEEWLGAPQLQMGHLGQASEEREQLRFAAADGAGASSAEAGRWSFRTERAVTEPANVSAPTPTGVPTPSLASYPFGGRPRMFSTGSAASTPSTPGAGLLSSASPHWTRAGSAAPGSNAGLVAFASGPATAGQGDAPTMQGSREASGSCSGARPLGPGTDPRARDQALELAASFWDQQDPQVGVGYRAAAHAAAAGLELREIRSGSAEALADMLALAAETSCEELGGDAAFDEEGEGGVEHSGHLRGSLVQVSSASLPERPWPHQAASPADHLEPQSMVAALRRASFPIGAHGAGLARTVSAAAAAAAAAAAPASGLPTRASAYQGARQGLPPIGAQAVRRQPLQHPQQHQQHQQQHQQHQQQGSRAPDAQGRGAGMGSTAARVSFQMAIFEEHLQHQMRLQQQTCQGHDEGIVGGHASQHSSYEQPLLQAQQPLFGTNADEERRHPDDQHTLTTLQNLRVNSGRHDALMPGTTGQQLWSQQQGLHEARPAAQQQAPPWHEGGGFADPGEDDMDC